MRIDEERLWATLMRSAEIGKGRSGGLCRLTLSAEDKAMRDQFAQWVKDDGFDLSIDGAGSMFARLAGQRDVPPVLVGSHLDTQVAGGRFDGILGVLSGLEVLRTLRDQKIVPRRPIEVVNWTNEEGARFTPPMMASSVFAGLQTLDWFYDRTDDEGIKAGDALEAIGYRGKAPVGKPIDAYFELHIEQGPELDAQGVTLGVVDGGYAVHGFIVRLIGETAHTGPTPMGRRKNALVGACNIAASVDAIGHRFAPIGKATVSRLVAWPNKPGILSDWAELTVDVRHADADAAEAMREEVLATIAEGAEKARVTAEIASTWTFGDEAFDPACADLVRQAADSLKVSRMDMKSQAGHDAYCLSRVAPTALLFSPCIDGISHNEAEDVPRGPTLDAANVLLHAVLARADRA